MANIKETKIERMLEEVEDGDLVELVLRENMLPIEMENYTKGNYMQILVGLEKTSSRLGYSGQSYLIESVIGYFGGVGRVSREMFFDPDDIAKQAARIYPMRQKVLMVNSSPPVGIEIPLTEIESYEIIKKGEKPVTPPWGFP